MAPCFPCVRSITGVAVIPTTEVRYTRSQLDPGTGKPEIMMVDAVVGTNSNQTITAQGGTVGVCLGNQDLDNIAGNIDIFSGFGFGSALAVNDALDPNPGDAWTLSFQNVSRFGSANIHYDGMDSFSVRGGDQGAKFDVETTTSATATRSHHAARPDLAWLKSQAATSTLPVRIGRAKK